jgi:hypothetical protein
MAAQFRGSQAVLLAQQQMQYREQVRLERLRAAAQIDALSRRAPAAPPGVITHPGPVGDPGERAMRGGSALGSVGAGSGRPLRTVSGHPAVSAAEGATAYLGENLIRNDQVRTKYVDEVRQLERTDPRRSELKEKYRKPTPAPQRRIVEAGRPSRGAPAGSGGTANRSNPKVNAMVKAGGRLGRASVATSLGLGAVEIARSENRPRAAAGVAGSTAGGVAGGIAGAEAGGAVGLLGGPWGAVGAVVGGLLGSIFGGVAGDEVGTRGYDIATGRQNRTATRNLKR